jgi:hypothetical protein
MNHYHRCWPFLDVLISVACLNSSSPEYDSNNWRRHGIHRLSAHHFLRYYIHRSRALDGAQSTSLSSSPGWHPNPTLVPLVGVETALLSSNDLRRREVGEGICGYISGQLGKRSKLLPRRLKRHL